MGSLIVIGLATISLGTIHESDGPKERDFWLRNAGTEAVAITQGYTSCGCTTVVLPKDSLILPGDSARVTLRFNPQGKGGDFEETATIVYSDKKPQISNLKSHIHLALTGTCITSEETLLRQFPISVSDSLRLSANRFDLGVMHLGETRQRTVAILHRNQGNRVEQIAVSFTVSHDTPKGLQHIAYPVSVGGQTAVITLDALIK